MRASALVNRQITSMIRSFRSFSQAWSSDVKGYTILLLGGLLLVDLNRPTIIPQENPGGPEYSATAPMRGGCRMEAAS